MWRCTLVVVLFGLGLASPAASQAVDGAQTVASLAELELPARHARMCPTPAEPPEASCDRVLEAQGAAPPPQDARSSWPVRAPEPPDWMVWLCGIAVAAVIAVRRVRGRGLFE
jgi:hypothetical protein